MGGKQSIVNMQLCVPHGFSTQYNPCQHILQLIPNVASHTRLQLILLPTRSYPNLLNYRRLSLLPSSNPMLGFLLPILQRLLCQISGLAKTVLPAKGSKNGLQDSLCTRH